MAKAKRARRGDSQRKGWITRRAREAAATKATEQRQREHGRIAREKTESRLTPQQKRARTIHARKIEREVRAARVSAARKRGWITRRANAAGKSKPVSGTKRRPSSARRARDTGGGSGGGVGAQGGAIYSLSQIDAWDYDYGDPDDYIEYDVDTSPDYA